MAIPSPPRPPGIGLRKIFTTPDGFPLEFFISADEPLHDKYVRLIEDHGGIVYPLESADLLSSVIIISSQPWNLRSTVGFRYIDDSIAKGFLVGVDTQARGLSRAESLASTADNINSSSYINTYDSKSLAVATAFETGAKKARQLREKPKNPRGPSKKFTPEADQYILEQVRMKPRYRTSHKFFEELAKHPQLHGHTGNSIRSRFRLQLENKMEYVYKTNEHDEIELDEHGQRLAVSVEGAKTLKMKFSADDDYNLCSDVLSHVLTHQTLNLIRSEDPSDPYELDESKFSVPILFFDQYAIRHPHHSSLSWRDRYRKFARVYGVQKYKDDYDALVGTKEGPQPMRRLTKRKEKKSEEEQGPRPKKIKAAEVYSHQLSALDSHNQDPAFQGHNSVHDMGSMSSHMDASAAAAVANMAVASRDNGSLDKSIINSNIHEALRDVGAEAGRVNIEDDMISAIHPTLAASVHGHHGVDEGEEENAFGDIGIKESESQDPLAELQYMPRNTVSDDLFRPEFYHLPLKARSKSFFKMLAELGPQDIGKVSDALENLGLTRAFVNHMLRVTSAHANYLNDYITHVFRLIENSTGLIEDVLYFHNRDGFWTPETDEALLKEDFGALRHMSQENIEVRRAFLEQCIV